jgi:hypothetical protein
MRQASTLSETTNSKAPSVASGGARPIRVCYFGGHHQYDAVIDAGSDAQIAEMRL